jgi:hypothetical protein
LIKRLTDPAIHKISRGESRFGAQKCLTDIWIELTRSAKVGIASIAEKEEQKLGDEADAGLTEISIGRQR